MENWQGYYDLAIMASQTDADQVITGTASAFKSTDGGASFKILGGYGGSFALHPDVQSCISVAAESWITTDGGVIYSTDFFKETSASKATNFGLNGSDFGVLISGGTRRYLSVDDITMGIQSIMKITKINSFGWGEQKALRDMSIRSTTVRFFSLT